ncbi:MAG: cysteine desulfurase family protein [Gemmataceae bacterium]
MTPFIYLDHNATTPMLPEVWEAMRPYGTDTYGNPASSHGAGRRARQALEDARERIATLLGAFADEVIFTSGATEANNLAIFGLAGSTPGHLIANPMEHPCVIEPLRQLAERGFTVDWLSVNAEGKVEAEPETDWLRPDTRLVCVMGVNHETGAIQPIERLRAQLPETVAFHCDATQAVGKLPVRFHDLGVTTMSLSAHKFHGPKGIGALLLNRCTRLRPLLWGGHQQQGRRPGTEPVPLVVGMAAALECWQRDADRRLEHVQELRQRFWEQVRTEAAPVVRNGSEKDNVPHTLNVSFPGCPAETLLMKLDLAGVACSTGSACSSGSLRPSPVLRAMRVPDDVLRSALRFSWSHVVTTAEVDEAARRVVTAVRQLRQQRPE